MNYDSKAMIAKLQKLKPYLGHDTKYFSRVGKWVGNDLSSVWGPLQTHLKLKTDRVLEVMQDANKVWKLLHQEGRIK